jgi:hypothetical protein
MEKKNQLIEHFMYFSPQFLAKFLARIAKNFVTSQLAASKIGVTSRLLQLSSQFGVMHDEHLIEILQ